MAERIKVEDLNLNEAYNKVLLWFFSFPDKEIGLSDLAETTEISKKTANAVVSKLEKEEFLHKEVIGRVWRLSVNKNHVFLYSKKLAATLTQLFESNIQGKVREVVPNPKTIILFGSFRKGDDTEKSDIDIAVEIIGDAEVRTHQLGILKEFFTYRKDVPVNLTIYFLPLRKFRREA